MARVQTVPTLPDDALIRAPVTAVEAASHLTKRVGDRKAQVRRRFVERIDNAPAAPPLARMLRGGRGGQVRLKLYLTMLWIGANPPHDVTYPARAYAELLGLREAETAGARRILDAIAWLEQNGFVTVESRPGHPSRVTLLSELGDGSPYSVPGAEFSKLRGKKDASDDLVARHRYVQLPPDLWTSGWLSVLSGPGLAMLLVLVTELGGRAADREVWFSPGMAKRRFDLSEETRTAGIRELAGAGLVKIMRRDTNPDPFAVRRLRNVYRLDVEGLADPAAVQPKRTAGTPDPGANADEGS